jgi:hypothetical protein
MNSLKSKNAALRIKEILRERKSKLADQVKNTESLAALPLQIREEIVDELSSEFSEKGLDADDEPNQYGLELENLIDACKLPHQ